MYAKVDENRPDLEIDVGHPSSLPYKVGIRGSSGLIATQTFVGPVDGENRAGRTASASVWARSALPPESIPTRKTEPRRYGEPDLTAAPLCRESIPSS